MRRRWQVKMTAWMVDANLVRLNQVNYQAKGSLSFLHLGGRVGMFKHPERCRESTIGTAGQKVCFVSRRVGGLTMPLHKPEAQVLRN